MRRFIAMVVLAWPLLATAQAQTSPRVPVNPGDSIRVLMRSGVQFQGALERQTVDSLVVRGAIDERSANTTVAFAEISSVESKARQHTARSALGGMGIGLLSGAAAGLVTYFVGTRDCTGDMCGIAILEVPFLGIVGGLTGLVVGSRRTTERWDVVWRQPAPADP